MIKKKKPTKVFSQEVIDTQHVFTEDDQVYIKNKATKNKNCQEAYSPIKFKWVSISDVQDCLVLE